MSGPINLGIHWDPNFQNRTEAGFQRLQKEADGEFLRLVTPYVPVRTRLRLPLPAQSRWRNARCWAAA